MTVLTRLRIRLPISAAIAVTPAVALGLAAVAASVIAATGVARGEASQQQPGFGAAARVAVGQAAMKLAPGSGISDTARNR
jgi:hypothetical protein